MVSALYFSVITDTSGCVYMSDITGKRYGKLIVVSFVGKNNEGRKKWLCECDCGGAGVYYKNNLYNGRSHCGCDANRKPNLKHGMRGHPLYPTWSSMVNRCGNPKSKDYKDYGARGISVCDEWVNDPVKFICDMGERPDGFSLDRIDNDRGYSKDNCRWADKRTQMKNRRVTAKLDNGMSINDVAKKTGLDSRTVYMRKYRGWTDNEIISGVRAKKR
jgi:hypothetical protein